MVNLRLQLSPSLAALISQQTVDVSRVQRGFLVFFTRFKRELEGTLIFGSCLGDRMNSQNLIQPHTFTIGMCNILHKNIM